MSSTADPFDELAALFLTDAQEARPDADANADPNADPAASFGTGPAARTEACALTMRRTPRGVSTSSAPSRSTPDATPSTASAPSPTRTGLPANTSRAAQRSR